MDREIKTIRIVDEFKIAATADKDLESNIQELESYISTRNRTGFSNIFSELMVIRCCKVSGRSRS